MEDIEYKLNTNNAAIISRTISTLIETIQEKLACKEQAKDKRKEVNELKYLKEKCVSPHSLINVTACKGLIKLVENGYLQPSNVISDLTSLLASAGSYTGMIAAISELLILELKNDIEEAEKNDLKYRCRYNLKLPQHPFISIILNNSQTWIDVYSHLIYMGKSDRKVEDKVFKLLRPFYLYVLCDYDNKVLPVFRQQLMQYLLPQLIDRQPIFLYEILSWVKVCSKERIFELSSFLVDAAMLISKQGDEATLEIVTIYLASILNEMIGRSINPKFVIQCLLGIVVKKRDLECYNCLLLMLSDAICYCSAVYLHDMLKYCEAILSLNRCNHFIIKAIKASCLHWLLQSNLLTQSCNEMLNNIINFNPTIIDSDNVINTNEIEDIEIFSSLLNTEAYIHVVKEICIIAESSNEDDILKWLEKVERAPVFTIKKLFNFLLGLMIFNFKNKNIMMKILSILDTCSNSYHDLTTNLLTIILFKLSNTSDSATHFKLLKMLPKMGILKENLPLVITTLQVLTMGPPKLKTFSITLFYDLWTYQVRCYSLLQSLLVQDKASDEWEFFTTKASVLMKLCEKRPELYGTELASHLSKILNKCKTNDGGVASSFAIQGLKYLCKEGIVDIATAWSTLAPSLNSENRVEVIQSLCDLLTEVAHLPEDVKYDAIIYEVVERLWKYATYHNSVEVNFAAYKALQCFTLEQLSAHVTGIIEDTESVPDNFGHIPGSCWITLMQNSNYAALFGLGDLLIDLISKEISGYHKGTYHIGENAREPINFNSLPHYSIVRAIGNFVKISVSKFEQKIVTEEIYLQCLRILSQEYSKPLPPLDWCFLQELVHFPSAREYCISIASHQVVLSGTARRFMENFIVTTTNATTNDDDILSIYKNLKFLANSIQPMLLKPFFENTFIYIMGKADKAQLLESVIKEIKTVFKDTEIQDSNKQVLSQVMMKTIQETSTENLMHQEYISCFSSLPEKYLKPIISLNNSKEMNSKDIQMAIMIRCSVALELTKSPLGVLDEALNVINGIPSEQLYLTSYLVKVFDKHKFHPSIVIWLLEFLGKMQVNLADNSYNSIKEFLYLCDVFMLAVIIFSGHDIFGDIILEETRFRLFPQALASLLKTKEWNNFTSQILEWLHYMTYYKTVPNTYKVVFCESLIALKDEDAFSDSFRWLKYVGTLIYN